MSEWVIIGNKSLTYYQYSIVNLDIEDLFQFVVTPRSNVEEASNGTLSVINVSYSLESKLFVSGQMYYYCALVSK